MIRSSRFRRLGFAVAAVALMGTGSALAQSQAYRPLASRSAQQDRFAYLLTVLDKDPAAHASIARHPDLKAIAEGRNRALSQAVETCASQAKCYIEAMRMPAADVARAGDALAALAKDGPVAAVVRNHLRPSGYFQRHKALSDPELIRAAWLETAAGVDRLYRVYGLAEAPHYPAIDAMTYDPADTRFGGMAATVAEAAVDEIQTYDLFFKAWAQLGLDLLVLNQRDEAVRYEPLAKGENAAAMARAATLDWKRYPYTAILIPGSGNRDEEIGLSAIGGLRVRLAQRRFEQGMAPFLIVSGGHVHPNKTPYNEALEMKRALVAQGVPADAILIDPYARHTTTNLRNAARLLFRAGAPVDRPFLVTSSRSQSAYIGGPVFTERNTAELGYQPMRLGRRLSPVDQEAWISLDSLQVDPQDPLDP